MAGHRGFNPHNVFPTHAQNPQSSYGHHKKCDHVAVHLRNSMVDWFMSSWFMVDGQFEGQKSLSRAFVKAGITASPRQGQSSHLQQGAQRSKESSKYTQHNLSILPKMFSRSLIAPDDSSPPLPHSPQANYVRPVPRIGLGGHSIS